MISFLKLIRYKNLLMVLLTMVLTKYALIGAFVERSYLSNFQFLILALSVIFITAGGYIINDIFDVEADKINKPNKIFIGKTISAKNARFSYIILSSIGIILGSFLSIEIQEYYYILIYLFSFLCLFFYSYSLKRKGLIGNILVGFLVTLSIIIVFVFSLLKNKPIPANIAVAKGFEALVLFFYLGIYLIFSFLTTLIREIIKDIEDINGDLKINAKTLPIVFGRKRANRVAFSISIILMILLIFISKSFLIEFPIFLGYSIVFVLLPLLYFIYKLWNAESKKEYSKLSQLMKLIMFFGILSMLFFKLI